MKNTLRFLCLLLLALPFSGMGAANTNIINASYDRSNGRFQLPTNPAFGSLSMTGALRASIGIDTSSNANAFGDSITAGIGPTAGNGYAAQLGRLKGWSITNQAISGTQIPDIAATIYSNIVGQSYNSFWLAGYNDMRANGVSGAGYTTVSNAIGALAAWLAIPEAKKIRGTNSAITYGGSWSGIGIYSSSGKVSTSQGATATVTLRGRTIYIGSISIDGQFDQGSFSLAIDGVEYGTNQMMAIAAPVSGLIYSPWLVRVSGLEDTNHSVVLTVRSSGALVYLDWCAGVSGVTAVGGPKVWIGDCLRMNPTGYAAGGPTFNFGSEVAVAGYNRLIESVCTTLAGDGLQVASVPVSGYYDPNTADDSGDNIHPGNVGAQKIANQFNAIMGGIVGPAQSQLSRRPPFIQTANDAFIVTGKMGVNSRFPLGEFQVGPLQGQSGSGGLLIDAFSGVSHGSLKMWGYTGGSIPVIQLAASSAGTGGGKSWISQLNGSYFGVGTTNPATNVHVMGEVRAIAGSFTNIGVGTVASPSFPFDLLTGDGVAAFKLRAPTQMLRLWPYVDATRGSMMDSVNPAENAYAVLSLMGSQITFNIGGTERLRVDASGVFNMTELRSGLVVVTNSINARTNIGVLDVSTNDFVVGTRYTNSTRRLFVSASAQLTAAVAGTAVVTLYVENLGSATNKVTVSAGPLASLITVEQLFLPVGPGMIWYFADEKTGAGASVALVSGTSSRVEW